MDELVRRHYARVFNLCLRLTGNYDDAQDLVSETFIRAFKALPEFRGDSYFGTWLYSIVRNVFLTNCKKKRRREHESLDQLLTLEEGSVRWEPPDPHPGPEASAEHAEFATVIHAAVQQLPEPQRLMVLLYHFQHLSYDEIAQVMDLPVGTVKSRINRARLALKGMLRSTLVSI